MRLFPRATSDVSRPTKQDLYLRAENAGITMVETAIGLAILGLVAVAFLSGVATSSRAAQISDRRVTAERLARSQIEYVKSQSYIRMDGGGRHYRLETFPSGFSGELQSVAMDPTTAQPLPAGQDVGLQEITVSVTQGSKAVFTLNDYKTDR
ncbi:MAG: type II secretion system protein [Chloroflexi bacterium]|nr:type II secretion system protein [Chloroflexota bacterium]